MDFSVRNQQFIQTLIFDIFAIIVVIMIPVFSHITAFPLYKLEPMRLLIISIMLFNLKNVKNAIVLCILLPAASFMIAGHPTLFKMPVIAIDLFLNIIIFSILVRKRMNIYFALFISVLVSKVVYYFIKALFINKGLLQAGLIETSLFYQFINLIILLVLAFFITIWKKE